MIDADLVEHIAELSRLELQAEEKQAAAADLERMVAFMDVLAGLDTEGVEPMGHVFPVKNVLREDRVIPSQARPELLAGPPAAGEGTFLVPKTVE